MNLKILIFIFTILIAFTLQIQAQNVIPDTSWWVTNGEVYAIANDGEYTYIGGYFTQVGPRTGCGIKLNTTDVSIDKTLPEVNGTIYTSIPDGSGGWCIGGEFTRVGNY